MKRIKLVSLVLLLIAVLVVSVGCGEAKANQQVVIFTNSDEEAIEVMEIALNGAGYEGKYIVQGMGTSELGGKLLAEGNDIEANIITMSTYFVESAQNQHNMFENLTFDAKPIGNYPSYYTPILANTGSIFVNTEVIKAENISMPTSIKDLTKPEYKGLVSVPSIMDSSTAWLMIQAIINEYGEEEGLEITKALVENCEAHIESSGSGPIKKVRVGEVAVGFGLRHQAVADQKEGKPIQFIDPVEGNFSLTESIAVVKNEDKDLVKLSMEMAEVIIKEGRAGLLEYYPVVLYKGEEIDALNKVGNSKTFKENLTVDLLKQHQEFFKEALN